jgi:hypothetical protein
MERDPSELPGMRRNPWILKTPDGKIDFKAFRDTELDPPAIVVLVGKRELRYHLRCLDDLYEMLRDRDGWVPLCSAEEQEPAESGSVEGWARSPDNPLGGWYGLKKGLRGGFASFIPPIMQALDLAQVEDTSPHGRMRAVGPKVAPQPDA